MFGPEQIPNGNLLKQNLPISVINVVNCLDSSANEVCQKPELASNSENILAPDNFDKVASTVGSICNSRHTFLFNLV